MALPVLPVVLAMKLCAHFNAIVKFSVNGKSNWQREPRKMEEILEKHREFLVERIDSDFGLLDKLQASRVLTREAVHRIKLRDNTTEDRNRLLLDFILLNKKVVELVSALRDSGQTHLANYIKYNGEVGHGYQDDWPLSESDFNLLEVNRESLMDLLDTTELCFKLYAEEVINYRQKQFICSKPTDAEKNEALLDILVKCSRRQYKTTIACLNDSNQSHVAKLLLEGGVAVRVHVNIADAVGNLDEQEEEIISKLTKVLEHRPAYEATRLLEMTQLRIIAAKKGHSIVIYIHCTTHNELQQLTDLLNSKRMAELYFGDLVSVGDTLRVTLNWSSKEFERAATYFASEMDYQTDDAVHAKDGKEKRIYKLPLRHSRPTEIRDRWSSGYSSLFEYDVAESTGYDNWNPKSFIPIYLTSHADAIYQGAERGRSHGTSRNIMKIVAGVIVDCGLAIGGAAAGATLGTLILPKVGTIIGGIIGALGIGIAGLKGEYAEEKAYGGGAGYDMK